MTIPVEVVKGKIYLIRGQKVLLDSDLTELYGVETKVLNQAVKRNLKYLPYVFFSTVICSREYAKSRRMQRTEVKICGFN